MDELARRMREQQREQDAHRNRMAAEADESHRHCRQFVQLMRTNDVPTWTLYVKTRERITPPPVKRFLRKPAQPESRIEDRYAVVGRGWLVEAGDADGTDYYLILESGVSHPCTPATRWGNEPLPGLEMPYAVTTTTENNLVENRRFIGKYGLDLLARNATTLLNRSR
ncbi:hypothetical protein ABZ816_15290 [Actinosynnema sp. NPDC047251]|uniref:Uncharacterized protein n=1 Tax=Saccharothrix espanaensis (strain ATCC 51144 / DSM 44229 / JCM 9112 / NBRC 15066 / NRRL 15764) TaxID=1179773 RepID=K0JUM7_SACES|nr:hypothetical protein [Saccharothrix espanaensis]CCH29616.1 hypothetical protein BN6_22960 [Saccharothrix espanaensis DSM 44229]